MEILYVCVCVCVCVCSYLPYFAAVESDHWLEAEISSSKIWPLDIPNGDRHTPVVKKNKQTKKKQLCFYKLFLQTML